MTHPCILHDESHGFQTWKTPATKTKPAQRPNNPTMDNVADIEPETKGDREKKIN